jgi:hypothetical protein
MMKTGDAFANITKDAQHFRFAQANTKPAKQNNQ